MSSVPKPNVKPYGSSFGEKDGPLLSNFKSIEVDRDKLNVTKLSEDVEFSEFEEQIKDFWLARLGHPTVRVELTTHQIKTAIDEATTEMSYWAPLFTRQFAVFEASAGCNTYELPKFILDNLEHVFYRKALFGLNYPINSLEFDFFLKYFSDTFTGRASMNMADFTIWQMYMKQLRKTLGQDGAWKIINNQYLVLFPVPAFLEDVIVEFRAIDANTIQPKYKNWIQRYALAACKEILGEVRSKYAILPGPAGGTKLNGEEMLERAVAEKTQLKEELMNEISDPLVWSMY